MLKETTAIRHLCELSYLDHNEQISKLADQTVRCSLPCTALHSASCIISYPQVDLVLALEPDLADLIRETKFRVFNAEWLNAVENGDDHDQVRINVAVSTFRSGLIQFDHGDDGESAYHSYSSAWADQEGLWSQGQKFVGDEGED